MISPYNKDPFLFINPEAFNTVFDGKPIEIFLLKNKNGLSAAFCNYGARWVSFVVPEINGQFKDIVLGFDSVQQYLDAEELYHGAIIGRVAGRIRQGILRLDKEVYQLSINETLANDLCNHLHGGLTGLSFQVWEGKNQTNEKGEEAVEFTYFSPNGEGGYPGNLAITVTYTLTKDNAVTIEYSAHTDMPTPVSLSNHVYFNLSGNKESTILNHSLQISAKKFLEFDPRNYCVTGKILSTENTPMNFIYPKRIGEDINANYYQLVDKSGYNTYYVLEKNEGAADAILQSDVTGRRLELFTSEPGMQLYCAGYWSGKDLGNSNRRHEKYSGVALEAHRYPDALNQPHFPTIILQPSQEYKQVTTYRVSSF